MISWAGLTVLCMQDLHEEAICNDTTKINNNNMLGTEIGDVLNCCSHNNPNK